MYQNTDCTKISHLIHGPLKQLKLEVNLFSEIILIQQMNLITAHFTRHWVLLALETLFTTL
jgi:hypothetical protein